VTLHRGQDGTCECPDAPVRITLVGTPTWEHCCLASAHISTVKCWARTIRIVPNFLDKKSGRTRNGAYQAGFEAKSAKYSGTGLGGCRTVTITSERSVRIGRRIGGGCYATKRHSKS